MKNHATAHKARITLALISALVPQAIYADTLHLKNGDVISGRVISYKGGLCIFSTNYGATIQVSTNDVHGIATDEAYQITFDNEDMLSGRLVYGKEQSSVESERFGIINIKAGSIKSMTRDFASLPPNRKAPGAGTSVVEKSFGEEIEEQAPLDFLTGTTVLLAPGKYEIDFGISHKSSRESFSLPAAGYFQRSTYAARQLTFDTTLRAGIADGIEGWISLPFSYTRIEQVSSNEYVRQNESWNLGDISFGMGYQFTQETARLPAISGTLGISAPTGKKKYRDITKNWLDPSDNSSGHWTITPGLSFVRTTDPAILFGGVNFQYAVPKTIDGHRIKPGWGAGLYLGMGFALNEHLSVGTRVSYSHQGRLEADGEKIYGSDIDPLDISFSASYRLIDTWVITPQVTFGLNDDAGQAAMSIRLRKQF